MSMRALAGAVTALLLCWGAAAAPRTEPDAGRAEPLAASPGKPSAPITIDFTLGAEPAVGATVEISITVRAAPELGGLELEVRAADPATLLVAAQVAGQDPAGGGRTWTVTVLPLEAAVAYLSVRAYGTVGGTELSRSLMVPVRTGPPKPAVRAAQAVGGEAGGQRLIVLPAQESDTPRSP